MASSFLHQIAGRHHGALDLTRTSLDADLDVDSKALAEEILPTSFALHQQLPTGSFFTSASQISFQDAAALTTGRFSGCSEQRADAHPSPYAGQASLVAVQPSALIDTEFLPKLGSYNRASKSHASPLYRLPASRRIAAGALLDYGPFASFAPSFDAEAGEITDRELEDVLWSKKQRVLKQRRAYSALKNAVDADTDMTDVTATKAPEPVIDPSLEMEDDLRRAVGQLQLEAGIDELLVKNADAMQHLVSLQNDRYRLGEKAPPVEPDSEEWRLGTYQ